MLDSLNGSHPLSLFQLTHTVYNAGGPFLLRAPSPNAVPNTWLTIVEPFHSLPFLDIRLRRGLLNNASH